MPFESWTDYLVAALWLIPVWAGAFAFGYRVAERQGWRELNEATRDYKDLIAQQDETIQSLLKDKSDLLDRIPQSQWPIPPGVRINRP